MDDEHGIFTIFINSFPENFVSSTNASKLQLSNWYTTSVFIPYKSNSFARTLSHWLYSMDFRFQRSILLISALFAISFDLSSGFVAFLFSSNIALFSHFRVFFALLFPTRHAPLSSTHLSYTYRSFMADIQIEDTQCSMYVYVCVCVTYIRELESRLCICNHYEREKKLL